MLQISNLSVQVAQKTIIQDCSVDFKLGQLHVVMGPNGSGKSSLACVIMGHPDYQIVSGDIVFNGQSIKDLAVYQKARLGMFLGLQHPVEIQGLQVGHFLKEILRIRLGKAVSFEELLGEVEPLLKIVGLPLTVLDRCVNVGFSGGEKKRFELLQMLLLKPKVAILDELDSGVDVDGLKQLAQGLVWYRSQNPESTIILITHYRHIISHLEPDSIHVMMQGQIVATGNLDMLSKIEQLGYEPYAKRS